MRARRALAEHRRGRGLDRDDLHVGLLLFQILADARHGAAGADAGDEDVHRAVGILPDLRARVGLVRRGVRGVDELAGDEAVRDLGGELIRLGDRALHALRALGEHELGAVRLHELAALDGHGLGHDDDDAIAARRRDRRQTDAGVAAGGLDDDGVRLQDALRLGLVDHRLGDAVLDRAGGVEVLQLREQLRLKAELLFNMGELQQRGAADDENLLMIVWIIG